MLGPRAPWLAATALLVVSVLPQDAAAQGRGSGSVGGSSGLGASRGGFSGGGLSTSPSSPSTPASPTFTPGTSAVGTPAPQAQPIAPLSPAPGSNFLSGTSANPVTTDTGGGSAPSTRSIGVGSIPAPTSGDTVTTFPGGGGPARATSASPSESAPSTPGGGAPGVAACMGFWDAGTHMSKREWAAACRRVEDRLAKLRSELNAAPQRLAPDAGAKATKGDQRKPSSRARVSGASPR
jgi:hypothetical protein